MKIKISLLIIFVLIAGIQLFAQIDSLKTYKIYVYDIKEEIAPAVVRKTQKAFKEAEALKADVILIHMNTYGGLVDAADSVRTKILNSKIPVYVFIDNNAASAGALISLACDKIFMRRGANIGAATVVNESGEAMPDKYQSYMRSLMRSTAQANGRDPLIAEAMVDPRIYIEGIIDSGKVLTFTTSEAITHGFCDGQAETIQEVLNVAGIKKYEIIEQKLTATDKIIGFLTNPMLSGILIIIIIGGIYLEVQSPGLAFPIIAAIIAAVLYFAPLYIEGLAEHWEILIFIIGLILLGIEIFAIPGFGITGILGIIFIVTGLSLSMIGNVGLNFEGVSASNLANAFSIVTLASFLALVGSFYFSRKLFTSKRFGSLALDTVQNKSDGFTSANILLDEMVGKQGIALTILRPSGNIMIDNELYDAVSQSSYIEKGEKVVVVKHDKMQLVVRKCEV